MFPLKFSNPWPRNLCPYCFTWFYWSECDIVMADVGDEKSDDGILRKGAPLRRGGDRREDLRQWIGKNPRYRCPGCGRLLPFGYDTAKNIVIGIVGGAGSAKTHYIAMLLHKLITTGVLDAIGCKEFEVPPGVRDRYNDDFFPNFIDQGLVLVKTQPADRTRPVEPIIYTMVFDDHTRGNACVNLILYDVSGEDIENDSRIRAHCRFVLNSDALIFLVDPVNMHGFRGDLRTDQLEDQRGKPAGAVLNIVKSFYREQWGIEFGKEIKIPLAVAISKSDLLRNSVGPTSPIVEDRQYDGGFCLEDVRSIDVAVRELMEHREDRSFLRNCTTFRPHHFFAVAPTGTPPGKDNRYADLAPRRCLDPFLWTLTQIGVIRSASVSVR